jgi:Xaa-Pro aminopeptidase
MPFTPAHFAIRRERLRKRLRDNQIQAMLVTDVTNVTYLTGFTGDDSLLLVDLAGERLLTDFRFTQQLEEECPQLPLEVRPTGVLLNEFLGEVLGKLNFESLAIEADTITLAQFEQIRKALPRLKLSSTSGLIEELRTIKDPEEIVAIRGAIRVAEQAFETVRGMLRPQMTEKEVADELEYRIRQAGGVCSSFPAIVGVGERGALPHGRPGAKKIGESEFVLIDWGARASWYISDLTRVLITGKPNQLLEERYNAVLEANRRGIAAIRAGAVQQEVDAAARDYLTERGYGEQFGHSLGHGIGLDVHEMPRLARKQENKLQANMVVTVEPGIYIPGWGGIRIEDDVLVTETGHEVLTSLPKAFADCIVS